MYHQEPVEAHTKVEEPVDVHEESIGEPRVEINNLDNIDFGLDNLKVF